MHRARFIAGTIALLTLAASSSLVAQQVIARPQDTRDAPPWGQRIQAKDGDVVMVEGDDRVRIVRRRPVIARVIANADQRWIILLVDFAARDKGPDGRVDRVYTWRQIEGAWPVAERWEGAAVLEEYHAPGQTPSAVGIVLPEGRVQLLPGSPSSAFFIDSKALAVLEHRSGTSAMGSGNLGFDEAEQRAVREIAASPQANTVNLPAPSPTSANLRVQGGTLSTREPAMYSTMTSGAAPVRVGGNIPMPRKIIDMAPIYPGAAKQAGVSGLVILEITLAADGSVSEARVLNGHPMLEQAAIDAARQWRYETTLLNGAPVPVRFTATVNFPK